MLVPPQTALYPVEAAVLLVLLPLLASPADEQQRADKLAGLDALQQMLGAAIRVLRVDEATHPNVVRSFSKAGSPAFVLLRHGVELWRHQGLPGGEVMARLLLSKLLPAVAI